MIVKMIKDKVHAACLDLQKAYDRADWEAMWEVLKAGLWSQKV